jgi:hypothetical protein
MHTWDFPERTLRELPGRCPVRVYIDDRTKIIEFSVFGNSVRFNADWIPPENLEWFADVMSLNLVEMYIKGQYDTKKGMQDKCCDILKFIGLNTGIRDPR